MNKILLALAVTPFCVTAYCKDFLQEFLLMHYR